MSSVRLSKTHPIYGVLRSLRCLMPLGRRCLIEVAYRRPRLRHRRPPQQELYWGTGGNRFSECCACRVSKSTFAFWVNRPPALVPATQGPLCRAHRPTPVALLAIYRQLHKSDRPWGYKYPGRPRDLSLLRLTKQHDLHLSLNYLRQ
jgi:hypothetical protein